MSELEDLDVQTEDSPIDFFADDTIEVDAEEPVSKKEEEKPANLDKKEEDEEEGEKKPTSKAEEEEEDDNIDFFGSGDDEEGEEENEDDPEAPAKKKKKDTEEPQEKSSVSTLNYLKEKGIIDFELEDGEELTEEKAAEMLEDSYDESVEKAITEKLSELPHAIKELNKFVINGGDPAKFLSNMAQRASSQIKPDLDISKAENQELVMKETLKAEGYDDDYIKTQLEFLKDSKKLQSVAETKYKKWEEENEKTQAQLAEQQRKQRDARKQAIRDNKKKVSEMLKTDKAVNGIEFDSREIKALPDYMHEPAYKLENGRQITEMEKDLMEAIQDDSKAALLAKILKSGFDFKSFKTDASTQVSNKVKKNLRRQSQEESSKKARKESSGSKPLADYF